MTALLELVANERRVLGLQINLDKTKLTVINRSNTTQLRLETVDNFICLGFLKANNGECEA